MGIVKKAEFVVFPKKFISNLGFKQDFVNF